jgi:diadenosine tetraphosphate (Ap4A) HIT family hydrolase
MAVHNALQKVTNPTKMNFAALGNMVPQLHLHLVARLHTDPAWPKPVFGAVPAIPYQPSEAGNLIAQLKAQLPSDWYKTIP